MTMIKCTICDGEFELSEALTKDIEKTLLSDVRTKHSAEIKQIKKDAENAKEKEIVEMEEKAKNEAAANLASKLQEIKDEVEETKQEKNELQDELKEALKDLRKSKKAERNAEVEMQRKLNKETGKITEEAEKAADEKYSLKIAESEMKLAETKKALEEAQRKAAQGSQQTQGEVLELELESKLREEFPFDDITEIKKGQRGADIKQMVQNQKGISCGCILWETKNAKWQKSWVAKFKKDIREAGANIGVLVSKEIPLDIGELKQLDGSVWVVSPRLATKLAVALRATILQVYNANAMSANKDSMMESLYQFLVGPEFKHRVEAMIESYTTLQEEIEKEKRAYALKWARQEKALRSVIDNTIGMYGDLQGITNRALPTIKTLELESGENIIAEDEIVD